MVFPAVSGRLGNGAMRNKHMTFLKSVAGVLNLGPRNMPGADTRIWEFAQSIVTAESIEEKVQLFNEIAKAHPVFMCANPEASLRAETTMGRMLIDLREHYFATGYWARVKQCVQCASWFVDVTTNNQAQRCSPHCTYTYWNRTRRKAAGNL